MRNNQPDRHDGDFEQALASGLRGQRGSDSACPDAETLAAFWDQSLAADERTFCEVHCATCLRCQAHLAALARTSAVEQNLAEERRPTSFGWLTDWRWLAPMATAAAVLLAVWSIDPAPLPDLQRPAVGDSDTAVEAIQESAEGRQTAALERQDVAPAERENLTPEADQRVPQVPDEVSVLDQAARAEPADPATPLEESRNRSSAPSATAALAERRLTPQSADASEATAPILERLEAGPMIQVASGDGPIRWRILPPGRVEHSVDGGTTWTEQLADASATLSAGFSPSSAVCWIVGANGTILRTSDGGETWERVTAPRQVDLIGIEAVDGRSATIDAVDGVSFRTEDSGLTWER